MMLRRSSENAMLATVKMLRRRLRNADLVTKRERVMGTMLRLFYLACERSEGRGQIAEVKNRQLGSASILRKGFRYVCLESLVPDSDPRRGYGWRRF